MTVGKLRAYLKDYPDDTPCSWDLWLPEDVEDLVRDEMPEDAPITDEEVEETLNRVYRVRDASIGTTWETVREELPKSVKARMI